jgi:hypothetical protein
MVRDLAYAVSTALDPEDRRAWERDLVTFYLDALAGTGAFVSSFEQTLQSKGAHLSTGITCPLLDRNRHDRLGRDHVVHRASVAAAAAFRIGRPVRCFIFNVVVRSDCSALSRVWQIVSWVTRQPGRCG